MVGWHHQLEGHEFDQTPRDCEGQAACCSPWGCKESDTTARLNNEQKLSRRKEAIKSGNQLETVKQREEIIHNVRCEVCETEILIDRKPTAAERVEEQLRRDE